MKLFNKFLLENKQTPLDPDRPYIIQIARFDPSKGIPDVIESYRILREMMKEHKKILPQLVITGNGSVDDPDGVPILNLVTEMLNSDKYKDIANDVKVARLPHIDQLLNTLLRKSAVCLQLSHKEGFEIKVTEALMKGIPIIAYRAGGIPLQIEDHITGFLVEVGNTRGVAKHLYDLLTDKTLYREMSENAAKRYRHDLLTIPNAICWLFLASSLLEKKPPMDGFGQSVYELAHKA